MFLAIGIAVVMGCKSEADKKLEAERMARPAKYVAALPDFSRKPEKVALVQQPYLKGKIAVLSSTDGKSTFGNAGFGWAITTGLPNLVDTVKEDPEAVKTVVLEECKSSKQGFYTTTENPPRQIPAVYHDCQMTIIDRTIQSVIYIKNFQAASMEKVSISPTSTSVTLTPTREMEEFLKSLPQNRR
ncbi:MAG: hypothetical protein LH614_19380 [Pyrinomonadaceae bacterium]|nr:hypothetical protein [Pyrinomonadaceae bacterium]